MSRCFLFDVPLSPLLLTSVALRRCDEMRLCISSSSESYDSVSDGRGGADGAVYTGRADGAGLNFRQRRNLLSRQLGKATEAHPAIVIAYFCDNRSVF